VVAHVSSKSVQSVRERLRLCKKKKIQIEELPADTSAPAGGIDKKAIGGVSSSPRKAGGTPHKAKSKSKVKMEESEDSEENGTKETELKDDSTTEV
jgi:hypothetical protein